LKSKGSDQLDKSKVNQRGQIKESKGSDQLDKSKGSDQLDNNKKQPIVISHTLRMVLNNCFGYQVYLTPLIYPFDLTPLILVLNNCFGYQVYLTPLI
jgi:hypothetical protein